MKKQLILVITMLVILNTQVFADVSLNTSFNGLITKPTSESTNIFPTIEMQMPEDVKVLYDQYPVLPMPNKDELEIELFRKLAGPQIGTAKEMKGVVKEHYEVVVVKGNEPIDIYVYKPLNLKKSTSGLLWLHGGGYIVGRAEQDPFFAEIVRASGSIVVAPEYRLAPENPFPAGLEDSYGALVWMDNNSEELLIDNNKIVVAGRSAGGGMTAAVSLLARDAGGPEIMYQFPLYPMLDYRNTSKSSRDITYDYLEGKGWNREFNILAWQAYLGTSIDAIENNNLEVSQYASPSLAKSFADLPPTYTMIGSLDPFKDETIEYVSELSKAGVNVELALYHGVVHGFENKFRQTPIGKKAYNAYFDKLIEVLKK